jgi:PAS domain-containing protein
VAIAAAGAATLVDVLRPAQTNASELALDVLTFLAVALTGLSAWRSSADARRTRGELHRSEARQRSVVEDAGEAVIVIDDQPGSSPSTPPPSACSATRRRRSLATASSA